MSCLARKARRDLWRLRGQAFAIALVIGAGIANLVMSQSTYRSIDETRARFYREHRFADVFAHARRAPESVAARLAEVEGVRQVETRVLAGANLAIEGFDEPVRAHVLSLPGHADGGELNRLYLRAGRLPDPAAPREVVVNEAFAGAHRLSVGDSLEATLHGHASRFTIVGLATSPEYVYQLQPGAAFPDFERFAILWTGRRPLEAALDMDGAFNAVTATLSPGARIEPVLAAFDGILAQYGGIGAHGREQQLSNRFLTEELKQLRTLAFVFPSIFLSVAAFLLNIVVARIVDTQREEIAILKAFGYGNAAIVFHFLSLVAAIAVLGAAIGIAAGWMLGAWLADVYRAFYRFPFLDYSVDATVVAAGVAVSLVAASAGASIAVWRAARLAPAEGMRPPAPLRYRAALVERIGLRRVLGQASRMVARGIERRPLKSLLGVLGLAAACAVMMVGRFQHDSIDYMIDAQFRAGQRHDVSVDFNEVTARSAVFELDALPGVEAVEPFRATAVVLRHGSRSYRTALQGWPSDASLKRAVDRDLRPVAIPAHGVLLTDHLASMLGVAPGDHVTVELLDRPRRPLQLLVGATVSEFIGANAYVELDALNALLGDGDVMSGAYLSVEQGRQREVIERLQQRPRVAGVSTRLDALRSFRDTLAESMLVFTFVAMALGGVINFGVVYNSARIALSEKARELASLRVLGFTHGEVTYILLGELALLVAIALPLGLAAGYGLCAYMAFALQSDLYRVPVRVSTDTLAFATATMLASSALSALAVAWRVRRLDLIAVLKTRE